MNTNPANFVLHEITDSCERLFQRFGIGSNGSGYPFEKKCHPFERLWLSVGKRNVIPSNDSGYPFEKNCHPFERLGLSVGKNCHPFGRLGLSVRRKLLSVRTARAIRLKQLSATLLFKVTFTRAVCDETVKKIM